MNRRKYQAFLITVSFGALGSIVPAAERAAANAGSAVPMPVLDRMDGSNIPSESRLADLPPEVVGAIGSPEEYTGDGRHQIHGVGFAPNGRFMVLAVGRTLRVWDLTGDRPLVFLETEARVGRGVCWAISGDSNTLVYLGGKTIELVNVGGVEAKPIASFRDPAFSGPPGNTLAMTPDAATVVVGHAAKSVPIQLWDVQTGAPTIRAVAGGHTHAVDRVTMSPDGSRFASGSFDMTNRLWDAQTGKQLQSWRAHNGHCWVLVFAPDGRALLTNSNGKTAYPRLWSLDSAEPQLELEMTDHAGQVRSAAFFPDGKTLATFGADGQLRLRTLPGGTIQQAIDLPAEADLEWHSMALAPDTKHLAVLHETGVVYFVRVR